jgi:hypothetical protein
MRLRYLLELRRDRARQQNNDLTMSVGRRSGDAHRPADEADQAVVRGFRTGAEPLLVGHLLARSESTERPEQERIKP